MRDTATPVSANSVQHIEHRSWRAPSPQPKSSCPRLEPADVMQLLESQSFMGTPRNVTFLLVDLRKSDWDGGTLATSINLPAQTFYQTRPIVYQLCKQAGIKTIIFYCGDSTARAAKCAGWMQDYLDEVKEVDMRAAVLKGGIVGWQRAYGGRMMDWYDERYWTENFSEGRPLGAA